MDYKKVVKKEEGKRKEKKEEKDDNKLPKGTIILDNIEYSNEIGNETNYKKNILEWYNN